MQLTNSPAAALAGVVKRYGGKTALDGVSLNIPRGSVTALLGPNGAGKSTAVALMLGLTTPDTGRVELFGRAPQEVVARRKIGVMLQTAALPETLRVGELVELASCYYPRPRKLGEVVRMAGIEDLLRRPYGALSGGQQRRVQFAVAICGNPELLFLDEPTTGLDTEAREALWDVVRKLIAQGCAVLLTTHYLEEAEALAHWVAVLVNGQIVTEGTVNSIRAVGVRRHIRCVSVLSAAQVRQWPGVAAVTAQGNRLEIEARIAEPIVQRLLMSDPSLSELEVSRAGLAEALVRITKGPMQASDGLACEGQPRSYTERAAPAHGGPMHASDGLACEGQPRSYTERAAPAHGEAA